MCKARFQLKLTLVIIIKNKYESGQLRLEEFNDSSVLRLSEALNSLCFLIRVKVGSITSSFTKVE